MIQIANILDAISPRASGKAHNIINRAAKSYTIRKSCYPTLLMMTWKTGTNRLTLFSLAPTIADVEEEIESGVDGDQEMIDANQDGEPLQG